jgi:hypothetical protein
MVKAKGVFRVRVFVLVLATGHVHPDLDPVKVLNKVSQVQYLKIQVPRKFDDGYSLFNSEHKSKI